MRVVLAGASGLIGSALAQNLRSDGHDVTTLVRRAPAAAGEVEWHPESRQLDPAALTGAAAVVGLSGANVAGKRWTDSYKQTLRSSRLDTTATIARALADLGAQAPATFVSASAIGYYGDTGEREVDESSPPGDGFLARLCVEWEQATQPASDAGVRVVRLRTAPVLAKNADLVKRLRPIIRAGLGGRLGSGRQFFPWISLDDEVRAIRFLLENDLAGPVIVAAPQQVRNVEFVKAFAAVMHRPAVLAVPGVALRIVLGELGADTLAGQRAVPAALTSAGFSFEHADIESALRAAVS